MEKNTGKANLADWGMLALRIAMVLFFFHGLQKISNIDGTAKFFGSMGIPAPEFLAVIVGLVETLCPIVILAGIGTRYAGILLAFVMLVAILTAKLAAVGKEGLPFGLLKMELEFAYMFAAIAVALIGPGKYSLEAVLEKKK